MQTPKTAVTLVLGASPNERRQSCKAVMKLLSHGYAVVAFGRRGGAIEDLEITTELPLDMRIDTVSIYMKKELQREYYDYILDLEPRRIIFNHKTYNQELKELAVEAGIQVVEGCTKLLVTAEEY